MENKTKYKWNYVTFATTEAKTFHVNDRDFPLKLKDENTSRAES